MMKQAVFLSLFVVATLAPTNGEIVKRTKRGSILDTLLHHDPHFSTKAPKVTIVQTKKHTTTEESTIISTNEAASRRQVNRKYDRSKITRKLPQKLEDPNKYKNIKLIALEDLVVLKVPIKVKQNTLKKFIKIRTQKKKFISERPNIIATIEDAKANKEEVDDNRVDVTEKPSNIAKKFRQKIDFTSDNIARKEVVDEDGEIKGEYSYTDPNGKLMVVRYSAGKNGFNVEIPVEEAKSSPGPPKRLEALRVVSNNLRVPQEINNKEWITSLFARTPSPPRSITTTTTTPPLTTTASPSLFSDQLSSQFSSQQIFQEQSTKQNFRKNPRFQAPAPRFQGVSNGYFAQQHNVQRNQFSRLEQSIHEQQNSHDEFLSQNRHKLFAQPPPPPQQFQQFGQFQ